MSKINEMKAEIDKLRLKYEICNLDGFRSEAQDYRSKICEKLEEYVVLLENEVKNLKSRA